MSNVELGEFPIIAFRALLAVPPQQREFLKRFIESSDEAQSLVRSMFAVLEHEHATTEEKKRALSTIAHSLSMDLVNGQPADARRPGFSVPVKQRESQCTSFAVRLNRLLVEKNITQEELAKRIGCTQPAVSKMLTRNARPRRTTILKMAKALRVDPTELWPQLEVSAILDSVEDFFEEQELTQDQAKALDAASNGPPVKTKTRELPSRKRG